MSPSGLRPATFCTSPYCAFSARCQTTSRKSPHQLWTHWMHFLALLHLLPLHRSEPQSHKIPSNQFFGQLPTPPRVAAAMPQLLDAIAGNGLVVLGQLLVDEEPFAISFALRNQSVAPISGFVMQFQSQCVWLSSCKRCEDAHQPLSTGRMYLCRHHPMLGFPF